MDKTCTNCGLLKSLDNFSKRSGGKHYNSHCKKCRADHEKIYYCNNLLYYKNYRKNNKEQIALSKRRWFLNNREKLAVQYKKRMCYDINFKLARRIRSRLGKALFNNQKYGSAITDLGCTVEQLKRHLESKFQPGMSWNNWGFDGWHIDHIIPLAKFNLANRNEFLKACNYMNLQPLWSVENLSKGATHEQIIYRGKSH